ncbi:MAG TPA: hypothetical protein VM366_01390 [Anaerolineae bacterium]|nr:hypothetical protein [Anaerolineae bacterium]
MTTYIKQEIWVEETEVDLKSGEVMTIAEAARQLGVYTQAVSLALDRGDLTVLIDLDAPKRQGRRLVLCSEIEAWKVRRQQRLGHDVPESSQRVTYTW